MDLTEFLLARIAEDEAAARMPPPGPWSFVGEPRETSVFSEPTGVSVAHVWQRDAHHIARWDPARVLAECDAKRRIVDNTRAARRAMGEAPLDQLLSAQDGPAAAYWRGLDYALRLLALPYADHPDYDPEWRP